ncbi:hypothetical protein BKA82DRAFT_4253736 [Pisolithus tinctorius]|nr:hypothetical protein BKA82DRAFT_4253736 [Pisolithus tinctorius]
MSMISRPQTDPSSRLCRYYSAGRCNKGSDCKFSHGNEGSLAPPCESTSTSAIEVVNSLATHSRDERRKPCHYWKAGNCKKGSDCKFLHGSESSLPSDREVASTSAAEVVSTPGTPSQDDRPSPCRYWKAGGYEKGSDCKFSHVNHDSPAFHSESASTSFLAHSTNMPINLHQALNSEGLECDGVPGVQARTCPDGSHAPGDTSRQPHLGHSVCRLWKAGTCTRGDNCWYLHADDIPTDSEAAQKEATETIGRVVQGSIVTYRAGLDIVGLISGFESCTLRVKNIPADAKEDEVCALVTQQGVDANRFHLVGIKSGGGGKVEAEIMTDERLGQILSTELNGTIFKDNELEVEVSAPNTLEGMTASSVQDPTVLTLSWHSPAVRYAVTYVDASAAQAKVRELNGWTYNHRRIKVQMNNEASGPLAPRTIIINNLPPETDDAEVVTFSGSSAVQQLKSTPVLSVDQVEDHLRGLAPYTVRRGFRSIDSSSIPDPNGFLSIRARFYSRDDALVAHQYLEDIRYGEQVGMWLRVPHPMDFTISLDPEQYSAQKPQWDALIGGLGDPKACMLNIHEDGDAVRIRLSGSQNDAVGALKVKVENLAGGETVQGWHRTLAHPKNKFSKQVLVETGVYMRVDWKTQVLKVYGSATSTERARKMISEELDRLSSADFTTTVPKPAVRSLINEGGLARLKETFGEDAVKFDITSKRITMSGGEEAWHALDGIVRTAMRNNQKHSTALQTETACPICLNDVSVSFNLGCGHAYCVTCLRHFLLSALEASEFPLRCLGNDGRCSISIPIPTIQHFLPPALFNRLLEAAFTFYLTRHPNEFKSCKTPDCTQIYRSTGSEAQVTLRCPSCFSVTCSSCGESHDGLQCAEVRRRQAEEEERQNSTWVAAQGGRVKRCPRCNVLIEKLEGCDHITCNCGAHICWRCMGIFTRDTIYTHMREAHQGIYDNEPQLFQGIDILEQHRLMQQIQQERDREEQRMEEMQARRARERQAAELAQRRQQERGRMVQTLREVHARNLREAELVQQRQQERGRMVQRLREVHARNLQEAELAQQRQQERDREEQRMRETQAQRAWDRQEAELAQQRQQERDREQQRMWERQEAELVQQHQQERDRVEQRLREMHEQRAREVREAELAQQRQQEGDRGEQRTGEMQAQRARERQEAELAQPHQQARGRMVQRLKEMQARWAQRAQEMREAELAQQRQQERNGEEQGIGARQEAQRAQEREEAERARLVQQREEQLRHVQEQEQEQARSWGGGCLIM